MTGRGAATGGGDRAPGRGDAPAPGPGEPKREIICGKRDPRWDRIEGGDTAYALEWGRELAHCEYISELDHALKVLTFADQDDAAVQQEIAFIHARMHNIGKARDVMDAAIEKHPENAALYTQRAQLYQQQGDDAEKDRAQAQKDYETAWQKGDHAAGLALAPLYKDQMRNGEANEILATVAGGEDEERAAKATRLQEEMALAAEYKKVSGGYESTNQHATYLFDKVKTFAKSHPSHAKAQYFLGKSLLWYGSEMFPDTYTEQSAKEAARPYLQKAHELGHAEATRFMAGYPVSGDWRENMKNSLALLAQAAERGSGDAANELGLSYSYHIYKMHNGKSWVPGKDVEKAIHYYKKGAYLGNVHAAHNLSYLLEENGGTPQECLKWIKMAQDLGYRRSKIAKRIADLEAKITTTAATEVE